MYYSTTANELIKLNIFSKSKKHCEKANETYIQHMFIAIKISSGLLLASMMGFVHSLIPGLFEKGASSKIIKLYNYLEKNKRIDHEN